MTVHEGSRMWFQYRKTFVRMQTIIFLVTLSVYSAFGHQWLQAAVFFAVMQIGLLIGSAWAARLSHAMERKKTMLPLELHR